MMNTHDAGFLTQTPWTSAGTPLPDRGPARPGDTPSRIAGACEEPIDGTLARWGRLLRTVEAQLERSAQRLGEATLPPQEQATLARLNEGLRSSVTVLGDLHETLRAEVMRRRQLELEVFDARVALAQQRAERSAAATPADAAPSTRHDPLTALASKEHFEAGLGRAVTQVELPAASFAVLHIDLDGFRGINASHGNDVGDEVLRIVAARLMRSLRRHDLIARLGGDQFGCVLGRIAAREHLVRLAGKLVDALSAPLKIGGVRLFTRPSIGIVRCPADADSAELLMHHADAAMHRAKRLRTGYEFFDRVGGF